MRIRVWNAYASNNSGSYTIVGSLPSKEVAQEVAEAFAVMIAAHTTWLAAEEQQKSGTESPLAQFCRTHGLAWSPGDGGTDDWPEPYDGNRPEVAAIDHQVIVHHPFTLGVPPVFGAYIYRQGGRVQHESNHAHHPILTLATFWWGWTKEERAQAESELTKLVAVLTAPDSPIMGRSARGWPSAWQANTRYPSLTVGVIFHDLIEGASALNDVARRHSARLHVRLQEAMDDTHDPFVHLRPSSPTVARFDVIITEAGDHRPKLVAAVAEAFSLHERDARHMLLTLPCRIASCVPEAHAESAASALRNAGAVVDLVRNDG